MFCFGIWILLIQWLPEYVESRSYLKDPLKFSNLRSYQSSQSLIQDDRILAQSKINPTRTHEAVSGPPIIYEPTESEGLADEGSPKASQLDAIGAAANDENIRTTTSAKAISGPPVIFPDSQEDSSADNGAPGASSLDSVGRAGNSENL